MSNVLDAGIIPPPSTAVSINSAGSGSKLENFPVRDKALKHKRYDSGRIYKKTRQFIYHKTNRMVVIASRGYKRTGYVPMKKTHPRFKQRRYSIDVTTNYVGANYITGLRQQRLTCHDECEPPVQPPKKLSLPIPSRHHDLAKRLPQPPFNEKIFLDLGSSVISNSSWRCMIKYASISDEAWMRDEGLNMALEVLWRNQNCVNYNIDFVNSNTAQVFYFASMLQDAHTRHYDEYRNKFKDSRWIFIVMNNGIGGEQHGGQHWSLIVMDRIHKKTHYYDSLWINLQSQKDLAYQISAGLLNILGENGGWKFVTEEYSPNQWANNLFTGDDGPCGPFVYEMTTLLINLIKEFIDADEEDGCILDLPHGFEEDFGRYFHSLNSRLKMQQSIFDWKRFQHGQDLAREHDEMALQGEDDDCESEAGSNLH